MTLCVYLNAAFSKYWIVLVYHQHRCCFFLPVNTKTLWLLLILSYESLLQGFPWWFLSDLWIIPRKHVKCIHAGRVFKLGEDSFKENTHTQSLKHQRRMGIFERIRKEMAWMLLLLTRRLYDPLIVSYFYLLPKAIIIQHWMGSGGLKQEETVVH